MSSFLIKTAEFIGKQVESDDAKRTKTFVISSEVVDSDKEVVLVKGINLTNFRKNPVVLFSHDPFAIVGKSLWEKRRSKEGIPELVAKVQFADTDVAEDVWKLCDTDFLRGASIGYPWAGLSVRECTPEDIKDNTHWKGARRIIEKTEMREWSIVSVPACPNALLEKSCFKVIKSYFKVSDETQDVTPKFRVCPAVELTKVEKKFLTSVEAEVIIRKRAAFIAGRI